MTILSKHDVKKDTNIQQISLESGIVREDLISTLQSLDMIKVGILQWRRRPLVSFFVLLIHLIISVIDCRRFGKVST